MRKYKGETVFGWDDESAHEGQSAFVESTSDARAGDSRPLSSQASLQAHRRHMARRRGSAAVLWIALALVALIGVAGVFALRHLLRA